MNTNLPLEQHRPFGQTSRTDRWWLTTLLVFLGLSAFIIYSTWAALQGINYHYTGNGANYLSPFYSPLLFDSPHAPSSGHSLLGPWPSWWPEFIPASPALLILWAPGGFRLTCYYYRGAYYKSFWASPPACSVGQPRRGYRGENSLPLILQNCHRYFLYLAITFIGILSWDSWHGFWFLNASGEGHHLELHLGSIVLFVNVILLGGYTFGCHSFRHLAGGCLDVLSNRPVRRTAWECASCLNRGHMKWAWASLFWVGFTDFYVRLCATGAITDLRIL